MPAVHRFSYWLTLLFLLVFDASAQDFQWAFGFGDWTDDSVSGITTDKEGNIYITGKAAGGSKIGDFDIEGGGIYVAKINPSGSVLWVRYFEADYGVDLLADSKGNIYATGIYSYPFEYENNTLPDGRNSSIYVLKLGTDGNFIWIKTFNGRKNDFTTTIVNGMALDPNTDDVYLAGKFENPLQIGDSLYNVRGRESFDSDMLIIKIDSTGKVLSVKNPGSTGEEYIYDIASDSEGIYAIGAVVGNRLQFDSAEYQLPKNSLGVIFRYSHSGEFQWMRYFDPPHYGVPYSLTVNSNNEAIVTGYWSTGNSLEEEYLFVSKVDKFGNILNYKFIQHPEYLVNYVAGVFGRKRWDVTTIGMDIYLSASLHKSATIGPLEFNSAGNRDAVVIKFNEVLYPQWIARSRGSGHETAMRITSFENYLYIGGEYTSNPLVIGETSLTNNSGNSDNDVFVARLEDVSANECPAVNNMEFNYDPVICEGDSGLLSINYPYSTYTIWYRNGEKLDMDNRNKIYISEEGSYKVIVNQNTRCPAGSIQIEVNNVQNKDSETNIVIYPRPKVEIEGLGPACTNGDLSLSTHYDESYTYLWKIPADFTHTDPTLNAIDLSFGHWPTSGLIQLEVKDTITGCVRQDSVSINVGSYPSVYISAPDEACVGDQKFIQAVNFDNSEYVWKIPESGVAEWSGGNLAVTFLEAVDSAKIVLEVTEPNSGCAVKDSVYIKVNPLPTFELENHGSELRVVSEDSLLIQWFLDGTMIPYSYNQKSHGISALGDYHVIGVSAATGCSTSSDTLSVDVLSLPRDRIPFMFPNPVHNYLVIKSDVIPEKIEVTDLKGATLITAYQESRIDLGSLPTGIYLVRITHSQGYSIQKVWKNDLYSDNFFTN